MIKPFKTRKKIAQLKLQNVLSELSQDRLDTLGRAFLSTNGFIILIDVEDLKWSKYPWRVQQKNTQGWYAQADFSVDGNRKTLYLHRVITNAQPDQEVDHRNHNTLDNRKRNLRIVTQQENLANRRRYAKRNIG